VQNPLERLFLQLVRWTHDSNTPEAYEKALKIIGLAMASAGVSDMAANEIITRLESPSLKTRVLAAKDVPMRLSALWTAFYEALESVGDRCGIVREWIEERRWIPANPRPSRTNLPPYPGDDPRHRN
jgi:hypothetical protein